MSGDFGYEGFDFDVIPQTVKNGNYRLKLTRATSRKDQEDVYGRNYWMLNFSIDDESEEKSEFNGTEPDVVYINFWPEMNEATFKKLQDDREAYKKFGDGVRQHRSIAEKMGSDPDAVKSLSTDFSEMLNDYFYADIFVTKDEKVKIKTSSIQTESAFDDKAFN